MRQTGIIFAIFLVWHLFDLTFTGTGYAFHRGLAGYAPTPLIEVPELAAATGIGRAFVKVEEQRFGLPAFKVLGASWAIARLAPPDPSFAADLWLLTHPDLRHAARVRVFLDFVAGEIARLRAFIEGETVTGGETAIRGETAP